MYNLLLCHDIHEHTPQTLNIHLTFVNELNDNEYTYTKIIFLPST